MPATCPAMCPSYVINVHLIRWRMQSRNSAMGSFLQFRLISSLSLTRTVNCLAVFNKPPSTHLRLYVPLPCSFTPLQAVWHSTWRRYVYSKFSLCHSDLLLEPRSLSAVSNCLLTTLAATLHSCSPSSLLLNREVYCLQGPIVGGKACKWRHKKGYY